MTNGDRFVVRAPGSRGQGLYLILRFLGRKAGWQSSWIAGAPEEATNFLNEETAWTGLANSGCGGSAEKGYEVMSLARAMEIERGARE